MPKTDLLQGTLDLLILKILTLGPNHGWGISSRIRQISRDGLNASCFYDADAGFIRGFEASYEFSFHGWRNGITVIQHKDVDGLFASWRVWLCGIGYNTKLVKVEEAPKSFADLLDPKWTGKLVKAHPSYSGTIMTATQQMARDLGWSYFEKLAKQKVMQVQSAADPPKKLALGERAVMVDGAEYTITRLKEKGEPVEFVYAAEGTPLITGPAAIMKNPPNPNAARLFHIWSFTVEAQQLNVDVGGLRSAHALVKERPDRTPLGQIKLMREDAVEVDRLADEIKAKYTQIFRV